LMALGASARRVSRIFEIRLLGFLGLTPELHACAHCSSVDLKDARFSLHKGGLLCRTCAPQDRTSIGILQGTVEFIKKVEELDFAKVTRIRVTERVGRELESILRKFIDYHVERKLNTVTFLKALHRA